MYHVVIHVLWAGTRTWPHLMLLFLLPHPLMSYCLNLPFGTQKRSRMLKASFLPAGNWWHRSFYTWRALRVLLSLISRLSLNSSSGGEQALDKKRTRFGERGPSKTGQMNSVLGGLGFTSQEWPLWEAHPRPRCPPCGRSGTQGSEPILPAPPQPRPLFSSEDVVAEPSVSSQEHKGGAQEVTQMNGLPDPKHEPQASHSFLQFWRGYAQCSPG